MRTSSSPRFLLGYRETAGYLARLRDGLEELGVYAEAIDLSGHPFGYPTTGWWVAPARFLANRRMLSSGWQSAVWRGLQWVLTAVTTLWALPRFDVFVLASLPPSAAVPAIGLLRLSGKRVIVVFNGSDSRPPYLDGFRGPRIDADAMARAVRRQRSAVRAMERWAHVVVSHTASSQFLTRPFVPFLRIGIPSLEIAASSAQVSRPLTRVLHAPSDPEAKGTSAIRSAIAAINFDTARIEYTELVGASHASVVAQLREADIVVDQLYSDQPMPGFATEAASLAKPVVIGGYDWDALRRENAGTAWPMTVQIRPEELESAIRTLVADRELRTQRGQQAQEFVREHWQPAAVAKRYVQLATGDFPSNWMYRPCEILAAHGYGMSAESSRSKIAALVASHGAGALGLRDCPAVEQRILARLSEAQS